ncbi:MAG: hypothetical protein ACR2OH_08295, partial [Microthrixaceae bacterium]
GEHMEDATLTLPPTDGSAASADAPLVSFSVTLRDGATEEVLGADAYAQEQSMTTFFRTDGRRTVDCWAVRMASFRTEQILAVRRNEAPAAPSGDCCRRR